MREVEWLQTGRNNSNDEYSRRAESFLEPGSEDQNRLRDVNPVDQFQTGELSRNLWEDLAHLLRTELIDYYVSQFVLGGEDSEIQPDIGDLEKQAETVLREDGFGLVKTVLETVSDEKETISPVRAIYLHWQDGKRGVMVLSVGTGEKWFLSLAVAPYEEYFDPDAAGEDRLPILERRWAEIPGDGSLFQSLVFGLRGDLEGLEKMGFVDRAREMGMKVV